MERTMLKHIVMWTLHDPADATYFKAQLDTCQGIVPGLLSLEAGLASAGLDATCHVVLNSSFSDKTALDAYQMHPQHLMVKGNVAKLVAARCVLDYWV
jgi:Stress responsive A/B Barrel Domain